MKNKNNHLKRILLVIISALLIFSSVFSGCSSGTSTAVSGVKSGSSLASENLSDLNYVSLNEGFTDVVVKDEKTALEAIASVADILGIEDAEKELKVCDVNTVDGDSFYRFQQYYNDIPVYGRTISLLADKYGSGLALTSNTIYIGDNLLEADFEEINKITKKVEKFIKREFGKDINIISLDEPNDDNLYCYTFDGLYTYVYILSLISDSGFYNVIVDAQTAEIVDIINQTRSVQKNFSLKGQKASQKFIAESKNGNNSMTYISKTGTDINVLIANDGHEHDWYYDGNATIVNWKNSEAPDRSSVDAISNITSTYNYFLEKFQRDSFSDNGETINVYVHNEDMKNNAFYWYSPNGPVFAFCKCYDESGKETNEYSSEIDVIGHEYTHGVVDYTCDLEDTITNIMPGAINEGIADIFGYLIEEETTDNTIDWIMVEDMRTAIKGGTGSEGQIYHIDEYNKGTSECHTASTIISYPAYLMWNGINGNKDFKIDSNTLSKIWYKSLFLMQSDATFSQCANAVYTAATTVQDITDSQLECVVKAFGEVGISINTGANCRIDKDSSLIVFDANLNKYSNYHLIIDQLFAVNNGGLKTPTNNSVIVDENVSSEEYSINLDVGKYNVTVIDNDSEGSQKEFSKTVLVLPVYPTKNLKIYTDFGSTPVSDFSIPKDMTLTLGEVNVIEPETTPNDATGYSLKWTSSDESVATVSPTGENGIITAKAKGEATITAELTSNGKTITKTTNVRVASQGRDTVLVLDVSGSMSGTPIDEMKKSAINFCNELLADEYNNRVGLVLYDDYIDSIDLTNDLDVLIDYIEGISSGGTTNMQGALAAAGNMLDSQGKDENIKNVVVMADGLPNEGETSDTGKMSQLTQYSSYSTDVAYANGVINTAENVMSNYNMYSLGFFHDLSGVEKDFAVDLMKMLTNMPDGYHQVDTAENLQFAFGDIQETISDGSKIVINIACPVDVNVTYNGETLSSAANTYSDKASFGTLQLLGANKDIKVLSLNPSIDYDIELIGTDTGTMDYSVNYIDDTENIIDYRSFESIPITATTVIDSNTNNAEEVTLNVDEDGDGEIDLIWSASPNSSATLTFGETQAEPEETPEPTVSNDSDSWKIVLVSVIVVLVFIAVIMIVVFLVSSGKRKNNQIEIPVINNPPKDNDSELDKKLPEISTKYAVVISTGSMSGTRFALDNEDTFCIGKGNDPSQINLSSDYSSVSRQHCMVTCNFEEDCYYVTDCSMNGTYFKNGRKLSKNVPAKVTHGTTLQLANSNCEVLFE